MTIHRAHDPRRHRGTLLRAAVVLGVGLGALLDGILFHRILGWHRFASGWTDDPAANRMADGLFDGAAWLVTLGGVFLLWSAWRRWGEPRPTSRLVGGMLGGWGGFVAAEGIVTHHVLGLHPLAEGAPLLWEVAYLAIGLALLAVGWYVTRASSKRLDQTGRHPHTRA